MHKSLAVARELSHPLTQTAALFYATCFYRLVREPHATYEQSKATLKLSLDQGFPYWLALGESLQGWALPVQGHGRESIDQIRRGISGWQATGAEQLRSYLLLMLAEAYSIAGRPAEALHQLTQALAIVEKTQERFYEPELYRLQGEFRLQLDNPKMPEAEACFHQAIEIARRQQTKSWELRATISLSRLWQQQGQQRSARSILFDIYHEFTEGFDTLDLQEAKHLLKP